MTDIGENQTNKTTRRDSAFANDFVKHIKNIKDDEGKLVEIAKRIRFVDEKNRIGGVTCEHLSINDEEGNVKMTVRVSNAANLAPQIDDPIVSRMRVISVGSQDDSIQELLHMIKHTNESSKNSNIDNI